MKLDDLNLFRLVVENSSYTSTSRKTGIPVATITRRIQTLEESLDLRLLNRNARKLALTEVGEHFYHQCSPLLQQLMQTTEEISANARGASGKLKIIAPTNLTKRLLMPQLNDFMKKYPDIQIELTMNNHTEQPDPTEWDIIFRVGPQRDSSLIARKIGTVKDVLVASPSYIATSATLKHANDLSHHSLLKGEPLLKWQLRNSKNENIINTDKGRFEANELNVVRQACLAGLGITLMPDVIVKEFLNEGSLVQVLPDWSANARDVYLLYVHRDHLPDKVRLFIDFIISDH